MGRGQPVAPAQGGVASVGVELRQRDLLVPILIRRRGAGIDAFGVGAAHALDERSGKTALTIMRSIEVIIKGRLRFRRGRDDDEFALGQLAALGGSSLT